MVAAQGDGKQHRSAWSAYKRRMAALAHRGGEIVSPLPVTVTKLRAMAAEYVLVEGLKSTSLAALATNLRQYVITTYGAPKWRLSDDDWAQWHTARRMLEKRSARRAATGAANPRRSYAPPSIPLAMPS
jgi:hypothetical protein